jgi:clan AA aspartic protease
MIHGSVVELQALVSVTFRLPNLPDIAIECVVDTGFEGALTLPPASVALLHLPFLTEMNTNLASDESFVAPVHRAVILWRGEELPVAVLAMGRRPLLGTALLAGSELVAQFVENGLVTIDDI